MLTSLVENISGAYELLAITYLDVCFVIGTNAQKAKRWPRPASIVSRRQKHPTVNAASRAEHAAASIDRREREGAIEMVNSGL
jgi:hypothetical protein